MTEDQNWRARAYCRSAVATSRHDPEIWYPETPQESWLGVSLCQRHCPVRAECLSYARRHHEVHGTWGGLSEWERNRRAA